MRQTHIYMLYLIRDGFVELAGEAMSGLQAWSLQDILAGL